MSRTKQTSSDEPPPDSRNYVAIAKRYAAQVLSGKIVACEWVRGACQRFIDDLARDDWEYRLDADRATHFCRFFELCPHAKGRWGSPTIKLEPWQCFQFVNIFGWVHKETELRRFRKALVVIPAKNSKSTMGAGVALYLLALDEEPGAEVYSAATTRDQAKIVWSTASSMVSKSAGMRDRFGIEALAHSIVIESEAAFFKPLSRDSETMEGINPNGIIIDELHAHKSREVFDVLDERTGARRQPLTYIISTEGDNPTGVFAEQVEYAHQILSGRHKDESYFCIIYTIDKDMDWTSREAWYCANPNLGVSIFEDELASRCLRAQKNPASQSSFLTKRLNVRVGAGEAYFNMLSWRGPCRKPELKLEDFYGKPVVIGLDLASKIDVAAKIYLFRENGRRYVFGKFYIPEDSLEKGNPNYDFYRGWVEKDYMIAVPGNIIDFEFIEEDLLQDRRLFRVQEVAFDPMQATELSTRMIKEGLKMVETPQTVKQLNEPMKEMGALILKGTLHHNGDPVLDWMIGNTMAKVDAKEQVFPRKGRPESKTDGAVATIFALSRDIFLSGSSTGSVYSERPMRFL